MLNDVVESFFDNELAYPFNDVMQSNGVPTAQISATFSAPSRLGDILTLGLTITALGRASMNLSFETRSDNELRFSATSVLVYVDDNGKPTPWPDAIRQAIQTNMNGDF